MEWLPELASLGRVSITNTTRNVIIEW